MRASRYIVCGSSARVDRVVIHVDFDHFYAQCEETRKPSLRAAPLVVCVFSGRGSDSGAVATANYIAREYDVRSGISVSLARRRLADAPNAQFLPVDFAFYESISESAMGIMSGYADIFEYVGRDEAYLDITTKSSADYNTALHIAQQIKNGIRTELSLTCSIGISSNRLVAKIASAHQKPDGLTLVKPGDIEGFLSPMSIRAIPGLGKKTESLLMSMGIRTITDLRECSVFRLVEILGRKTGTYLHNAAIGRDDTAVSERAANLQYSKIATLEHNSTDAVFIRKSIPALCAKVHEAVLKDARTFRTVGVHIIQSDLVTKSRSVTLRKPTSSLSEMERAATDLLCNMLESQKTLVRRIGVKVSELGKSEGQCSMDDYG